MSIVYKNLGIPGASSEDLRGTWWDTNIIADEPDLVIIMIGANDPSEPVTEARYRDNMKYFAQTINTYGGKVVFMSYIPYHDEEDCRLYGTSCNVSPHIFPGMDIMDNWRIQKEAADDAIALIGGESDAALYHDNYYSMIEFDEKPISRLELYQSDRIHATKHGNYWIANNVMKTLRSFNTLDNVKSISFVGSSSTYSYGDIEGGGTMFGETYPSYFRQIMERDFIVRSVEKIAGEQLSSSEYNEVINGLRNSLKRTPIDYTPVNVATPVITGNTQADIQKSIDYSEAVFRQLKLREL